MVGFYLLLSAASLVVGLIILVGLWLIWHKLTKLEDLINELGSMLGEWIDGQGKG
jgi:hypothetical protein